MIGLLYTFITGIFFLLGIILNKICKGNKNIGVLSIALAFIILLNLIVFDLLPEVIETISFTSGIFILLGFLLLKIMDFFVPHHHHDHKEKNDNHEEHTGHIEHISIITVLALVLHNIIECMALFSVGNTDIKSGALMCAGIALHNIPLGFQIGNNIKNYKVLFISLLTLSGFIGGLIAFNFSDIPELWTGYILCFTLGMLLYLTILELLKEVWQNRKNVFALYGIIIGLLIIGISFLI